MADKEKADKKEDTTFADDLGDSWDDAGFDDIGNEADTGKEDDKKPVKEAAEKDSEKETDKDKEPDDKEDAKEASSETDDKSSDETDDVGKDENDPPEHWDSAQKNDFEALPDEAKPLYLEKVKSLEAGYNKKFEDVANDRKEFETYKPFKEMFEPHEQELAMAGTSPEAYTRQLLATAKALAENPEKVIHQLAEQYGVNLTGKTSEVAEEELDEFTDPEIRGLHAKIDGLSSQLKESEQQSAATERQQVANREQNIQREWMEFAEAKSDTGAEVNPHAEALKQYCGFELQRNPLQPGESNADAFKRAYDIVKWQVPELRDSLMNASAKEKDAEREKFRKADLKKAKKTGRVVKTKSNSVSEADAPAGTVKEELERAWDTGVEEMSA